MSNLHFHNVKKMPWILSLSFMLFLGCVDERPTPDHCIECQINGMTKEQGDNFLGEIYKSLQQISQSKACTDASQWSYAAVGSKPCGGPMAYLPYHRSIIVKDFLEQVENYTLAQQAYNKKWGVGSYCDVVPQPKGIECVDGKAKLL